MVRPSILAASVLVLLFLGHPAEAQISFLAAVDTPVGAAGSRAVAAADLDADGDADLVVAAGTANAVVVMKNGGVAAFLAQPPVSVGTDPRGVAVGDFDGNGTVDAAVSCLGSGTVSVLSNDGAGVLAPVAVLAAAAGARALAATDLDGDGDLDLVVACGTANALAVFLNGGGVFGPAALVAAPGGPRAVEAADLDGDGDRDLVVANATAGTLTVFTLAGGSFTLAQTLAAGSIANAVAVGDLDGDGDRDVIASSFLPPNLAVFTNTAGVLGAAVFIPAGTHFQSVVLADLDVDGDLDAAGSDVATNVLTALANLGGGPFGASQSFAVGAEPGPALARDFDGDFIPDVVTANFAGNSISVLLNALPGPVLGPAASSLVPDGMGGVADVLTIDGQAGGAARRVSVPVGQPFTVAIGSPPTNPFGAAFLLYGYAGAAMATNVTPLPLGIGDFSFVPYHLDPSAPGAAILVNGAFPDPAAAINAPPGPWSLTLPVAAPLVVTLQAVVDTGGGALRRTNGVILDVQ